MDNFGEPPGREKQTVERVLALDRDALEELLLARYKWLRSVAAQAMADGRLEGPIGVEDVLQESLVRILRGFSNFTPQSGEAGLFQWLKTIVQNTARDALRRQRRSPELHSDLSAAPADEEVSDFLTELAVANDYLPSTVAQKKELIRAFRIVLSNLDATYQQVIDLLYFQQRSVEEVAELMQTTPAAIRGYRGRARDKIREGLIRLSNFV